MSAALPALVLIPFAGGAAAFLFRRTGQLVLGLLAALATAATVGLLTLEVLRSGPQVCPLGGWAVPLGIHLRCDGLSLLMLLLTAVVSSVTSIYAAFYFVGAEGDEQFVKPFWPVWLLLWGGLNGIFVSGDIFNLYLLLEFTLLASVALASLAGSHAALVSAFRYLLAATVAALVYLLGVAMLYSEYSTLDLEGLRAVAPSGFLPLLALALMAAGLALKSALFPLHFWLPPAHSTAPAPVSAVLSALVVKAGLYVMVRLWLLAFPGGSLAAGAQLLAVLGAAAIVWGSWQALRQVRLKLLVAYSTVAQMGYPFLLFPLAGTANDAVVAATTYHVISHGLAKGAMFLAAGALVKTAHSDLLDHTRGSLRKAPMAVAAILVAGATFAGIAPGGGPKRKLFDLVLDAGQWWWAAVIALGMLLSFLYTIAALRYCVLPAAGDAPRARHPGLGLLSLVLALLGMAASLHSDALLSLLNIRTGGW
jgi:multicomponent Na+:H+ antiporter subunit D